VTADADELKEPVWEKGTQYPYECALWVWSGRLIELAKRGTHEEWLKSMLKLHNEKVVEDIKNLARRRWKAEATR